MIYSPAKISSWWNCHIPAIPVNCQKFGFPITFIFHITCFILLHITCLFGGYGNWKQFWFLTMGPSFWFQLLIVVMTLFFGHEQKDLAITMTVSILVAVYTMYISVQASLPKTAYLKFIDFWVLVCLFIHFLILLIHLVTKKFQSRTLLKIFRLLLPCPIILFIIFYIITAVYYYKNLWRN